MLSTSLPTFRRLAGLVFVAGVLAAPLMAAQETELIVRHLIMPGHVECCWRPVAAWLAEEFPSTADLVI